MIATKTARVLIATVLLLAAAGQAADSRADEGKQEAKQHFVKGEKLFDERRYAEAAREFNAAYSLAPHPQVLFNIATCHEKAGDIPAAVLAYRRYIAEAQDTAEISAIKSKLNKLEQKVGEVRVGCAISPCQVKVDGADKGSAPLSVVLSPGRHDLVAVFGGQIVEKTAVEVEAGKKTSVTLALKVDPAALAAAAAEEPEPVSEPEPVAPADADGATLGVPFWIATGVTVAAGATTVVFGVMTLKDEQEFDDSDRLDEDIAERGERDRLITNIMIGVTGAAGATALAFAIHDIWFDDEGEEEDQGQGDLTLGPGPGLGIAVGGTF